MAEASITLKEIQLELDQYIKQFKEGYFPALSQLANLIEEVGELASEINQTFGNKQKKKTAVPSSVAEELGDVLITLIIMANAFGLDLDNVYQNNMKKFKQRDAFRFERVDGRTDEVEGCR